MTAEEKVAEASEEKKKEDSKPGFTFTKDGCRTEIRVGALLLLAGIFFWLFLGPATCTKICLVGLVAILIGVPLQALDAKKYNRPGYPKLLGWIFTIGGLAMLPDLCYRESIGGPLQIQIIGPLIVIAGVWMLAWMPVARFSGAQANGERAHDA